MKFAVCATVVATLLSGSAAADEAEAPAPEASPPPVSVERPRERSFEVRLGGTTVRANDFNYVVREENAAAVGLGGTDFKLDEIKTAFELSGYVTLPDGNGNDIAIGGTLLARETEDSGTLGGLGSMTESFAAGAILANAYYRFKLVQSGGFQLYVAPGLGYGVFTYVTEAEGSAADAQFGGKRKISAGAMGLTAGFEAGAKYLFHPQFGIAAYGGYRYAKSAQLKVTEQERANVREDDRLVRSDGQPFKIDLSGITLGAGIFIAF